MTRKDYVAIAAALKRVRDSQWEPWNPNLFSRICDEHAYTVADALAADNPRFDRTRFIEACGAEFVLCKEGVR